MASKFAQKHPYQDAQDWDLYEWLQLPLFEPRDTEAQKYAALDQAFLLPERSTVFEQSEARREALYKISLKLQDDVEGLTKYAVLGDNQALQVLARLGASICESLNAIYEQNPERVTFLSRRMSAWPINLESTPNVLKHLDALLEKLAVGRDTDDPYDMPRSLTRGGGTPKNAAAKLVSIIDALDKFGWAKEEYEMMQAEFVAVPDKYDAVRQTQLSESYARLVDRYFGVAEKRLKDFAEFLEVENPFPDREAMYRESRTCHGLNDVTGKGDAWATKGMALLERFTEGRPEQCQVFRGIGKSKAEATLRESGKTSGRLPPRSFATGLRGQIKKAFKSLRRADGTLGTPPHISWSSRETIEKFLFEGSLSEEQLVYRKG